MSDIISITYLTLVIALAQSQDDSLDNSKHLSYIVHIYIRTIYIVRNFCCTLEEFCVMSRVPPPH